MKYGMVLKIENGMAAVMKHGGEFVTVRAGKGWKEGSLVRLPAARLYPRSLVAAAACLLVVCSASAWGVGSYYSEAAVVSLDVNPSIELVANRFNRVIGAVSYNREGREILERSHVKNKTLEDAIDELFISGLDRYIGKSTYVTLTVQSDDKEKEERLLAEAKAVAEQAVAMSEAARAKGKSSAAGAAGAEGQEGNPAGWPGAEGQEGSLAGWPGAEGQEGNPAGWPAAEGQEGNPAVWPGAEDEEGNPAGRLGAEGQEGNPAVWPGAEGQEGNPAVWPGAEDEEGNPAGRPAAEGQEGNPAVWPGAEGQEGNPAGWPGAEGQEGNPAGWPGAEDEEGNPAGWLGAEGQEGNPAGWPGAEGQEENPAVWPGVVGTDAAGTVAAYAGEMRQAQSPQVVAYAVDKATVESAHGHHVTAGKYMALMELQEVMPDMNVEEYSNCSISEIRRQIDTCSEAHGSRSGHNVYTKEGGAAYSGSTGNTDAADGNSGAAGSSCHERQSAPEDNRFSGAVNGSSDGQNGSTSGGAANPPSAQNGQAGSQSTKNASPQTQPYDQRESPPGHHHSHRCQ